MPYEYHGRHHDVEPPKPLYPPRPYQRKPLPGNDLLKAAAAEMYPNDSRLHANRANSPAADPYVVGHVGRRMRETTSRKFDQVARLIPTGATREQILKDVGWDEQAFKKACWRHGMSKLWDAMPREDKPRAKPGRRRGRYGPHQATINRLDDLADLLQDPGCSKEEALQRVGWLSYQSFWRAARRVGRDHIIQLYNEHGQNVSHTHLVRARQISASRH